MAGTVSTRPGSCAAASSAGFLHGLGFSRTRTFLQRVFFHAASGCCDSLLASEALLDKRERVNDYPVTV